MPGIITPSLPVAGSILLALEVSGESVEAIENRWSFLQLLKKLAYKPVIFSYQHGVCKRRSSKRDSSHSGCMKRQVNVTPVKMPAALVSTAS
jgi:hypothetical protein